MGAMKSRAPHRRPDGERQVGRRARARRAVRRRRSSTPTRCRSIAICRVLTARPSEAEERQAPHRLFGEIDGAENFSVGRWLERARAKSSPKRSDRAAAAAVRRRHRALFPRADAKASPTSRACPRRCARRCAPRPKGSRRRRCTRGSPTHDPLTAARLRPSDRQRVLRALEVVAATGRPLVEFQGAREAPALPAGEWAGLFLAPERDALNARIEARFATMLRDGALDEVAALAARAARSRAAGRCARTACRI